MAINLTTKLTVISLWRAADQREMRDALGRKITPKFSGFLLLTIVFSLVSSLFQRRAFGLRGSAVLKDVNEMSSITGIPVLIS